VESKAGRSKGRACSTTFDFPTFDFSDFPLSAFRLILQPMSESAADFLISTLTDLLQVVVWGGLAAGALLVWRPRLARRVTLLQAGLGAIVAAGLMVCFLTHDSPLTLEFGSWLTLGLEPTAGIRMAHRVDMPAAVFLFAATMPFLLTAEGCGRVAGAGPKGSPGGCDRTLTGASQSLQPRPPVRWLLLQAVLQFVLVDDQALRTAFLPLMGLCCLGGRVCDPAATTGEVVAARRAFLFRLAGDGTLLLGAALIASAGFPDQTAAIPQAGTLLWVGVLLRTVGYPFFSDDDSSHDDALERVLVLPAGILVLLRMRPVYAGVEFVEHGLLYSGVVLALLAGGIAAARPRGGKSAITIALTGMMLAGLGTGSAAGLQGAMLLFASQALLVPAFQGLQRDRSMPAFANVVLLGVGLCGQGLILAPMLATAELRVPAVVLLIAHVATAYSLARSVTIDDGSKSRTRIPFNLIGVGMVVALILAAHANPGGLIRDAFQQTVPSGRPPWAVDLFEFAVVVILGAIGLTAGWMTRQRTVVSARPPGNFRRWLRAGFFLEELFLLAVVLPLRGVAQLCRFFEWFIIERLWDLPRRAPEWLARLGEPLRGGTVWLSLAAILLATAALLGVIVGLGK
jgi:hypothetical protein